MAIINQDSIILFQIVILISKIWFLGIVIFSLVFYLIDIIIKDQYL